MTPPHQRHPKYHKPSASNPYIIAGGLEGKKRLNVLSEVLHDSTKALLEADGPIKGKKFLDVGSGGGNVALMAAELVSKNGHVTAVDFDSAITELAKQDAEAQGIRNISYRVLNAYDLDYDGEFDIAYARFLLSHLQEPMVVLKRMLKALKPGGQLIIEDIDFSGHFCYPPNKAFDSYLHYFVTAARNNGQDANIGPRLFGMFQEAKVENIKFDVIQPSFSEGKGKWMAYFTMDKIKETVFRQGLASAEEFEAVLQELGGITNNKSSIISLPRIFRVRGKEG